MEDSPKAIPFCVLQCFALIKYLYLHAKLGFNIFRTMNIVHIHIHTPICHCVVAKPKYIAAATAAAMIGLFVDEILC